VSAHEKRPVPYPRQDCGELHPLPAQERVPVLVTLAAVVARVTARIGNHWRTAKAHPDPAVRERAMVRAMALEVVLEDIRREAPDAGR